MLNECIHFCEITWVGAVHSSRHPNLILTYFQGNINCYILSLYNPLPATNHQCCQSSSLPAQLCYFEIACRGSKNCLAGGLKMGYFSSVCLLHLIFLQICQFPVQEPKSAFWGPNSFPEDFVIIILFFFLFLFFVFVFVFFCDSGTPFDFKALLKSVCTPYWKFLVQPLSLLWKSLP